MFIFFLGPLWTSKPNFVLVTNSNQLKFCWFTQTIPLICSIFNHCHLNNTHTPLQQLLKYSFMVFELSLSLIVLEALPFYLNFMTSVYFKHMHFWVHIFALQNFFYLYYVSLLVAKTCWKVIVHFCKVVESQS